MFFTKPKDKKIFDLNLDGEQDILISTDRWTFPQNILFQIVAKTNIRAKQLSLIITILAVMKS